MKKPLACLIAIIAAFSISSCSSNSATNGNATSNNVQNESIQNDKDTAVEQDAEDPEQPTPQVSVSSLDELNTEVTEYIDSEIADLQAHYDGLTAEIGDYNAYVENVEKVQQFYASALSSTQTICLQMYQFALDYATFVTTSDKDFPDQYDDMEELYDVVYDEEGERIYDEIYDGIMSDAYDYFYDGIVSDGYDLASYDEWSDYSSNEYEQWSDALSDIYEVWSDTRSDIYEFYSDVRSDVYSKEKEEVEKDISRFQEDMTDLREDLLAE